MPDAEGVVYEEVVQEEDGVAYGTRDFGHYGAYAVVAVAVWAKGISRFSFFLVWEGLDWIGGR